MTYYRVPMTFITTKDLIVKANNEADAKVEAMGLNFVTEETTQTLDWDLTVTGKTEEVSDEELLNKNIPWS